MTASNKVNTLNNLFEFNYDESTRVNNTISLAQVSKRKKMMKFDCNNRMRSNKQKLKLQKKLKQQKRKALEKLVDKHNKTKVK